MGEERGKAREGDVGGFGGEEVKGSEGKHWLNHLNGLIK